MTFRTIFRRGTPALAVAALVGVAVLPAEREPAPAEADLAAPAAAEAVEPAEREKTATRRAATPERDVRAAAEPRSASTARPALEVHRGEASYYADALHGRTTASGVPYDRNAMVAAHRSLPFGTLLRVTNTRNGRQVHVRVVDRGPFARGRILDLSHRAARELDFIRQGHALVRAEVLEWGEG